MTLNLKALGTVPTYVLRSTMAEIPRKLDYYSALNHDALLDRTLAERAAVLTELAARGVDATR